MNANALQGKLQKLEGLLDRQGRISDDQQLAITKLREQVRRLSGDKQQLEAENQRLTVQVNHLMNKLGSK
jgi:hypothetical protein